MAEGVEEVVEFKYSWTVLCQLGDIKGEVRVTAVKKMCIGEIS